MSPIKAARALGRRVLADLMAGWLWLSGRLARTFARVARSLGVQSGKPTLPKESMNPHPYTQSLVERFRLIERGRERGKNNQPVPTQPGLDRVETEVVDYCGHLFSEKKDAYRRTARLAKQRAVPPVSAIGADAEVEKACDRMRGRVQEERPTLKGLHRSAQKAIDDLKDFKKTHLLTREAHVPKNLASSFGILVALLVLETLINGLFFGQNMETGMFGGVAYAALISIINVGVFGLLAASAIRQISHLDQTRKTGGGLLLVAVVAVAVVWNLAVAHYREALPADYPPHPEVAEIATTSVEPQIADCWRGPNEADADGEAICLLVNNWFSLNGFQSYMLMLIGMLMCGVAAWKWMRMTDLYPGFGRMEKHRLETEQELLDERQDLLERLSDDLQVAETQQHSLFVDPVRNWKRAMEAHEDLEQSYQGLSDFAKELEEQCLSAIETYRTANREAPRSEPEPAFWSKPWKANWEMPAKPSLDKHELRDRNRAQIESENARNQRDERLAKLRKCADECKAEVGQITRINYE